ncbi:MAG: hypothetical protein HY268_28135 [Deltaproteobacteria bacterium]|nr:hypothetical protein [Deltaproteobacteria bacterium]
MEQLQTIQNLDGSTTEYTDISLTPGHLERLLRELFEQHWREIIFGPCIQGAVFEVQLTEQPKKIAMFDGYLTVDVGPWHFHLCIDEHKDVPVAELARQRQVARAAFFQDKRSTGHVLGSWGLRLWNGLGEQMITIFFPNPYLTDAQKIRPEPDWRRLTLWQQLRQRYAGTAQGIASVAD